METFSEGAKIIIYAFIGLVALGALATAIAMAWVFISEKIEVIVPQSSPGKGVWALLKIVFTVLLGIAIVALLVAWRLQAA